MIRVGRRPTRFVVLFEGRTGSSYLIASLQGIPGIKAQGEGLVGRKREGAGAQLKWAREAWTVPWITTVTAAGFKTKLRDVVDREAFARMLDAYEVKVIYMQRRNLIKTVTSMLRSRKLKEGKVNDYNAYGADQVLPAMEVSVDEFDRLLRYREDLDREMAGYVGRLQRPVMPLYYEDFFEDPEKGLKQVCRFIGAPYRLPRGERPLKNTPSRLQDAITNFRDLKAAYAGTQYYEMFERE